MLNRPSPVDSVVCQMSMQHHPKRVINQANQPNAPKSFNIEEESKEAGMVEEVKRENVFEFTDKLMEKLGTPAMLI